jgi:DNA-binding transcriptional regulator GbsR (MarR family)
MERTDASDDERRFVEDIGILLEDFRLPRMAGRIVGRLLITVPAEQSSDQLAEALDASPGSISTMTRQLIDLGLLERVGMPGERRDYFRIRPGSWEKLIAARLRGYEEMHLVAERGLQLPVAQDEGVRERLQGMHLVYEVLSEHVPAMLEELTRRLVR